ncbi:MULTISPECIES: GntR family transcriptional regulator [unclassified Streptomyces]|uniref:GntR family transcriptional regulator n=1 Tax=unclassified Streptomyces TaxID=2593676 RepID=UPI002E313942|nr:MULTISPECIES: GntR family transcriptional regulator [unclassified Streptomyces]
MSSRRHVIADDLRNQILSGRIEAGARLPSEAQLAARYAVSTPTLRSALALLQGEGLVEKFHGSGNFVRRARLRITYVGGSRASAVQLATDRTLRVRVEATHLRAQAHLAALLNVPPGSPLTEFLCLSHEGKSAHSLTRIYVPRDLAPADLSGALSDPEDIAAKLAALRPPLAEVQETVSAGLPTPEDAAALRISTSLAVLSIRRVATDTTGRVVEAALLLLPGDRADAHFTARHTREERGSNA